MKLSEFASIYKVSERHVRRLLKKYEADMVGHYEKRGNEGTFLDDVGVEILKSKLRVQFDVVESGPSEDEKQRNEQLIVALAKCAALGEQLADAERRAGQNAGAVALLEAAKEKERMLENRAEQAEADRLQAIETLEMMRQEAQEAEERAAKAEERAQTAENIAEASGQEADRAKAEAEALKLELEELKKRGFWARVFNR